MLSKRLYYQIKPYLPWSFRMALRRIVARQKRKVFSDVWPISEAAARPPQGWPGWPDRKKFAFVLTHDVEGPGGLAKCLQLMQLEKELGFHSSFNFVPEGEYAVSRELRWDLVENGFEVGVHDLHHDGKLYWSRRDFSENAKWINHYLNEWGAKGFRSAFMLRNLEWLHELNIQYDASTFDTDPFEPQPDGVNTIFPFWVPKSLARQAGEGVRRTAEGCDMPNSEPRSAFPLSPTEQPSSIFHLPSSATSRSGYVELPYTLVQDSTLFLSLRETSPEIWLRKLDWIVQHGGMALLNAHPDYLRFPGETPLPHTFPVEHYIQFLKYLADHYRAIVWHPLPWEMAQFVSSLKPARPVHKPCRVCIVSYSIYETDTRVFRYGQTLSERGDEVDAMVLSGSRHSPAEERIEGVRVLRIQTREGNKERSKLSYLVPLLRFLAVASWRIARIHARRPYDLVHVHNVPDFLVFSALRPKLSGAKIILDIHDLVPEFFASKFGVRTSPIGQLALNWMERFSARFANHVILANELWLEKYASRAASAEKCSVMVNYVDRYLFAPRQRSRKDNRFIVLFPGGLQWHQGLDIAINAFASLKNRLPQAELHIYGEGSSKPDLMRLAHQTGLGEKVRFFDLLSTQKIAGIMAEADLGVVPKRADTFGNEAYSTKIMEFMSLGVPVVVSSTKIDRFYFDDSVARFFESGNHEALAEAIIEVLQNDHLRRRLVANGLAYAERNSWQLHKGDYLELVDSLIENRPIRLGGVEQKIPPCDENGLKNGVVDKDAKFEPVIVK